MRSVGTAPPGCESKWWECLAVTLSPYRQSFPETKPSARNESTKVRSSKVYAGPGLGSTVVPGTTVVTTDGTGGGATVVTTGRATGCAALEREYAARSSHLPKIIFPAVVCSTEVTDTSIVLPIILRALSTTTMVPSSR